MRMQEIVDSLNSLPKTPRSECSRALVYSCMKHFEIVDMLQSAGLSNDHLPSIMTKIGATAVAAIATASGQDVMSLANEYSEYLKISMKDIQEL